MFLESFTLPLDMENDLLNERGFHNGGKFAYVDNPYPCGLFAERELPEIYFRNITIFYGGNGSGKSTLLNLISSKLELNRIAPFNSSEMFDLYVKHCSYELGYDDEGFKHKVPDGSRIITSDDIFDYMLTVRSSNDEISENKETAREQWSNIKYGETVQFNGMEDYEALRLQVLARSKSVSRRKFIQRTVGSEIKLNSNGETAIQYFQTKLKSDKLYCLDEPENSLSPKLQLELVRLLNEMVRYCGCQIIMATHSPFLLALDNARIYDLDTTPICQRNWWELENVQIYYEFFKKHQSLFEH